MLCKRLSIRLVVFDADKTLWDNPNASSLELPFKRVGEDSLVDARGNRLNLFSSIRELLQVLRSEGIVLALATWNKPEQIKEALRILELEPFFRYVAAEFHPRKHLLLRETLKNLSDEGTHLKPEEILYVDDRDIHLKDIRKTVGRVAFLQMWKDVTHPNEILSYVKNTNLKNPSG